MVHRTVRIAGGRVESAHLSERSRLFIEGRELSMPAGSIILPGFVDTHCHLIGLGLMASRVGLQGARSAAECARRVASHAAGVPVGEWIVGFGWNQEEWDVRSMPDRHVLDAAVPDHPVLLQRIDSHAVWMNSPGLRCAGIEPAEIEGGRVDVDAAGEPTGILIDNATKLAEAMLPEPGKEQRRRWIEWSAAECLRLGITEVHDMNVEPERIEPMTLAADGGGLPLRCQVFLAGGRDEWRAFPSPRTIAPNLGIVGVKYFADGALGSRGALLLEPYSDAPETRGLPLITARELAARAAEPLERGFAIATHAIGDGANRTVLDAYAELRGRFPAGLLRVEHAQIVHPDDVPRFAGLGIIPTMQATHCTSDAMMAEARLGSERGRYAYGWRFLRDHGVPLLGGSDFPIESPDPLAGLLAFNAREPVPGAGSWHGEQAISRDEALSAYTEWAPLGIPAQPRRGRLREGYDADIVVLDRDPFDRDCRVLLTIVAGTVVYRATG